MKIYTSNSRKWLLFVLVISIIGCPATSNVKVIKPVDNQIKNYSNLAVEMKFDNSKSDKLVSQLEGSIIGRLRDLEIFDRVFSLRLNPKENFDLKLVIDEEKISYVSTGERAFLGAFAGRGAVSINTKLLTHYDEILGEAVIQGKSSAGTGYSGDTFQAVERVAEQIVNFIQSYKVN